MLGKALQASAHSVPATLSYLNSFIGLISVQSLCLVIGLLVDCPSPPLGSNPVRTRTLFELNVVLPLVLSRNA